MGSWTVTIPDSSPSPGWRADLVAYIGRTPMELFCLGALPRSVLERIKFAGCEPSAETDHVAVILCSRYLAKPDVDGQVRARYRDEDVCLVIDAIRHELGDPPAMSGIDAGASAVEALQLRGHVSLALDVLWRRSA